MRKDINGEKPLAILQRHFSQEEIDSVEFEERYRDLRRWNMVEDVDALDKAIKIWRSYKEAQEECMLFLGKTNGMAKYYAEKGFGLGRMKMREYIIEDHRDRLDLFRMELDRRYKGMAMVQFGDAATKRPWVLVPEDPIGAWGHDFPYRIEELVCLARRRFLMTEDEKEFELKQDAAEYIMENSTGMMKMFMAKRTEGNLEEVVERLKRGDTLDDLLRVDENAEFNEIVDAVRDEKEGLFHQDEFPIVLPGNLGTLGPEFSEKPVTRDDYAALQVTDEELVQLGSWRVED